MEQITINKAMENQRFDKFLKKYLPNAGASFLYKMLRKKNIVLNNKKATGNEILKEHDLVSIYFSNDTLVKFKEKSAKAEQFDDNYQKSYHQLKDQVSIIFENEDMMVLNKPSGLLSQKTSPNDVSINEYAIGYLMNSKKISTKDFNLIKPSICNRLDRNTSGVLLFGKTLVGLQTINLLIKEHKINKYYRCILQGKLEKPIYLKGYLSKDPKTNKATISNIKTENSSSIETELNPISYGENLTYAEIRLITGKTHQIRAHVASIGHPIIGDYKYGNKEINQYYKEQCQISSQMLHAYRIVFPNMEESLRDISKKEFRADLPAEFDRVLEKFF